MDTVLLILGVLGAGAVIISTYVFMVAARNYVTDHSDENNRNTAVASDNFIKRSDQDRRTGGHFDFPMTVNGMLIPHERRTFLDRRCATI